MVDLVPVEHDPFQPSLVPVEHDPFAIGDPYGAPDPTKLQDAPTITQPTPLQGDVNLVVNSLLGTAGLPRFETFPERIVRSAIDLPGDIMSGRVQTQVVPPSVPITSDASPIDDVLGRTRDAAALALMGGMPFAERGALGAAGSRGIASPLPMDEASRLARATAMGFRPDMPLKFGTAPEGEKIASAAVKLNNQVFTGTNHSDAIAKAEDELGIPFDEMKSAPIMDGFTTTAGRFVSRREAAYIAQREAQGETGGMFGQNWGLASEDMTPAPVGAADGSRTGATAPGLMGGAGLWGGLPEAGQSLKSALWHRADRPADFDASGLEDHDVQAYLQQAWSNGHDMVRMFNYVRPGGKKPETIVVVRDLSQLRSPRAAFDPTKKLSPNILAGFGAVAAIPTAATLMPVDHDPFQ